MSAPHRTAKKIFQRNRGSKRPSNKVMFDGPFSDVGASPTAAMGDSLDWKELPAADITKRVTSKVASGSICLFHNAAIHTPEALPSILSYLQSNGYTVVPISQVILSCDYYMDHTGRQCPAEKAGA